MDGGSSLGYGSGMRVLASLVISLFLATSTMAYEVDDADYHVAKELFDSVSQRWASIHSTAEALDRYRLLQGELRPLQTQIEQHSGRFNFTPLIACEVMAVEADLAGTAILMGLMGADEDADTYIRAAANYARYEAECYEALSAHDKLARTGADAVEFQAAGQSIVATYRFHMNMLLGMSEQFGSQDNWSRLDARLRDDVLQDLERAHIDYLVAREGENVDATERHAFNTCLEASREFAAYLHRLRLTLQFETPLDAASDDTFSNQVGACEAAVSEAGL